MQLVTFLEQITITFRNNNEKNDQKTRQSLFFHHHPTNNQSIANEKIPENAISGRADFSVVLIRQATRLLQNKPIAKTRVWISKLSEVVCPTLAKPVMPIKFHPHPSGSETTGRTYENLVKAKEIVNAIQDIKPKGTSTWL